jgi:hypothetical protein
MCVSWSYLHGISQAQHLRFKDDMHQSVSEFFLETARQVKCYAVDALPSVQLIVVEHHFRRTQIIAVVEEPIFARLVREVAHG